MLGKTHRVTAPTGLPKVMESAVVHGRNPQETQPPASFYGDSKGLYTHDDSAQVPRGCSYTRGLQVPG
jgi:hypothetical protein